MPPSLLMNFLSFYCECMNIETGYTHAGTYCYSNVNFDYENDILVNREVEKLHVAYNVENLEKGSVAEVKRIALHELMHA